MPAWSPRRSWQSSMTCADVLLGREDRRLDDTARGSRRSAPGRACRTGSWTSSSSPLVSVTSKPTRRHRRHQLEVVLALQALAHDVHVQQPEEAAAEAEAQRVGGLGLPGQRGVVERELLQRVAQVGVVVGVDREQAAEDHRLDLAVAGQRLARRRGRLRRQRVADAQLRDVLDAGDEVADLARAQLAARRSSRA